MYCDNQEAVALNKQPGHLNSYIRFVEANADVNAEINSTLKNINATVHLIHIKGHQDDDGGFEYDKAPLSVRTNIDMDEEAKRFLKQNQGRFNPTRITPFYPASRIALKIHNSVVASNLENHVKLHKNGPKLEERLVKKEILNSTHLPWIQWRGLERAMKRLKTVYKIPVMKIIYNKWSTEATISDWYEAQEGNCLRCQLESESQTHVYQCLSENGKSTHLEAIKSFRNDMQRAKTIPMITD